MNFFFILLLYTTSFSSNTKPPLTPQKPELLIYDCDTFYLYVEFRESSPLSNLFSIEQYSKRLESNIDTTCWTSSCARYFSPDWKIENNQLFLNKLLHCCSDEEVSLSKVFKRRKIRKNGVKAFWVNEVFSVSDRYVSYYDPPDEYFKIKWYSIEIKEGIIQSMKEKN